MFSEKEYDEGKSVVVIEEGGAKSLFGYEDVVGQTINIGSKSSPKKATIIGVTKSSFAMFGADENMPAIVYAPVTFVNALYPNDFNIDSITVMATSKENGEEAGNGALNVLQSRHNNRDREVYKADNALKQLDQINQVLGIFTTFIAAVAAISLLVGGIGVMNIMLVSVTERTREIGIRKAIGATTNTILLQFLTESVIISMLGGIIGLILGLVGAYAIGSLAGITPVLSAGTIAIAIIFSMSVGIFFGIYPARKAAKLDPIDALRYE
jgi:putative ABC transport system permease protein